jgi:protein-L-isoaspartate(D-aspartate) O-methyltransferase
MNKTQLIESLKKRGFSKEIINAFSRVKRENFLPEKLKEQAYEDIALSIGNGQTISQPYTIAMMLSFLELKKGQKVLEIGSGSGYVLALLSVIIGSKGKVYGIERLRELADKSVEVLKPYKNTEVYNKNGIYGLPEKAPFDRIIISAGYNEIPARLILQLKERGIVVAPLGLGSEKSLMQFKKIKGKLQLKKQIPGFVFVPLID